MRILIINPPHPSIGSRIPREHLPPLGLLSVGGSLLDAGHIVKLIDGEFGPMPAEELARHAVAWRPDAVLIGHWTQLFYAEKHRRVIQTNLARWDYKHQVLATRHVSAWRVLAWVKFIEVLMQMRPRAWPRVLWHPDRALRHAQRWYYRMGRRVWFYEIWKFLAADKHTKEGPTVGEFWHHEVDGEEALVKLTINHAKTQADDVSATCAATRPRACATLAEI